METVSSTTVLTTPGNLTSTMQIYYDRVFLERSMMAKRYDYLAGSKKVPKNSGKVVYFNRMTAYTPTTTALTEGATPTGVNSTSSIVSGTLASYGSFEQISTLFQMTSIDAGLKELTENFGQFAGESMDTYLRNIMFAGATEQFAGSNTKLTGIATSNVLSVTELRKAVLTLKTNKAPTFESGMYRGVISAHGIYNLQGDTTAGNWLTVNAATSRQNSEEIKRGYIGRIAGIDLVESNNELTQASTTTVYSNFIAGKGAVAEVDISGSGQSHIIVKKPGSTSTDNPLDMYSTVGWKVKAYTAVVLNGDWLIDIQCGTS